MKPFVMVSNKTFGTHEKVFVELKEKVWSFNNT